MKYSVGDRVLIRSNLKHLDYCGGIHVSRGIHALAGKVVTISCVHTPGWYDIKEVETYGNALTDEMIERKVDMTRDDLKTGKYMVKCRNGCFGNTVEGTNYVNGLTDEFNDRYGDRNHDIMEVYELKSIWKREEKVKVIIGDIEMSIPAEKAEEIKQQLL